MINKRKSNLSFNISVEGQDEKIYLMRVQEIINNLPLKYTVNFNIKKDNPTSFVKSNVIGYEKYPFYHIKDFESSENSEFYFSIDECIKAKQLRDILGYKFYYTNICFELWIILHKKLFTSRITNTKDYLKQINQCYNMKIKSFKDLKQESVYKKIVAQIDINDILTAIKNAKHITNNNKINYNISRYKNVEYYKENPSLNLHEFIEFILKEVGYLKIK